MRHWKCMIGALAVGFVVVHTGPALATDYFSFTYSDLDGDFTVDPDVSSLLFTAADDSDTDGDVTRLIAPAGDAFFLGTLADGGFPDPASFLMEMQLTNLGPMSAEILTGAGGEPLAFFTLTDIDGDVITGTIDGTWVNIGGSATFGGLLTDVTIESDDGVFQGNDGTGFLTEFPTDPPFFGNIVMLSFGGWFTDEEGAPTNFSDATTLTSGVVVPEPATVLLLAFASLALLARRGRLG